MNPFKYLIAGMILVALVIPWTVSAGDTLTLYAAGSLKNAMGDVAKAFESAYQTQVTLKFGPSGLLRKAIEEGEAPDVFASANMGHPEKLATAGWGGPVVMFTRNQLCALCRPEIETTPETLLATLLNDGVRVGTSTPKADPSGDYAWELFKRADTIQPGSFDKLSGKALQLTGGPDSPKAPEGKNQYGWVMSENRADVFLTYCTNAVLARKQVPELEIVQIRPDLNVGADYGLIVRNGAPEKAWQLAMFILSSEGRKILGDYGFEVTAARTE